MYRSQVTHNSLKFITEGYEILKAKEKIYTCILSCKSLAQLESCKSLIRSFQKLFSEYRDYKKHNSEIREVLSYKFRTVC